MQDRNKPLFSFERVQCDDGVLLNAVLFEPSDASTALVFIGGLTATSTSKMDTLNALAGRGSEDGVAVLGLDTRGAGLMLSVRKLDPESDRGYSKMPSGTAIERFEDCVLDIQAAVRFLRDRGYKRVVVAGHSTGANKATFALGTSPIEGVVGAALLGPASDVGVHPREASKRAIRKNLKKASKMAEEGNGDELVPLVEESGRYSASRYLSLFSPGSPEDTFPTYDKKATFDALSNISVPLFFCFGEHEEHLLRSPEKELAILERHATSSPAIETCIIPKAGHSFAMQEKPLAQALFSWLNGLS